MRHSLVAFAAAVCLATSFAAHATIITYTTPSTGANGQRIDVVLLRGCHHHVQWLFFLTCEFCGWRCRPGYFVRAICGT